MFNDYAQPDNERTKAILEEATQAIALALDKALQHATTPLEARLLGDWLSRSVDVQTCERVLRLAMDKRKKERTK